jgi:excisionase family DNA binding protein
MRKRTTSPGGRLMDLRTAAAYLGCSYWTLRDLVLNGHIPAVRIPSPRARDGRVMRRILIDSRDLERLIERWKEVRRFSTQPDDHYASVTTEGGTNGHDVQTRRRLVGQVLPERSANEGVEPQQQGIRRDQLLKLREGDIAHGLPINPKLNRIRFDEAAEDLKTEYAVNGR